MNLFIFIFSFCFYVKKVFLTDVRSLFTIFTYNSFVNFEKNINSLIQLKLFGHRYEIEKYLFF